MRLSKITSVSAGLGQKQTVDFKLNIASASETVVVQEQAPLINPENPNTSTTLTARAIEDLPNPGGDMTYPLQFAAGALINTAGSGNDFVGGTNGYGNVQFNGLPSLSNGYIVDGLETNDPLTNLNSGLSTNLVLGLNSIAEVTVNTLSYAVDQGRYGASQVNYVTKSGTNQFHGNLYELWNGSKFNAADFFTNATPGNHKPRSTVNHFGGSLGGPILHDKLFFFFDSEWVRIALPIVTATTVPTPAFQNYVLRAIAARRCGLHNRIHLSAGAPARAVLPEALFALRQHRGYSAGGSRLSIQQRWDRGGGQSAEWKRLREPAERFAFERRSRAGANGARRLQHRLRTTSPGSGFRPTPDCRPPIPIRSIRCSTPSLRSRFTRLRPGYTHVFSGHLVNYFNPAFSWYESLFGPADFQKTLAAFPIVLQGSGANAPFTTLGGLDNTWVQGRRATRFFINDNLAWTVGSARIPVRNQQPDLPPERLRFR